MRRIITILLLFISFGANAQTFPSTDSLRNFIDKWIRNSAIQPFTNLRLNTALKGIINEIDSLEGSGGADTSLLVKYSDTSAILEDYRDALNAKQATLVSGTSIRTINNTSILGSGNIDIDFDTAGLFQDYQDAINGRVKYTDTSGMFAAYLTAVLNRVRYSDTTAMLTAYANGLNNRSLLSHTHAFADITSTTNVALKNADNAFSTAQTVTGQITQIMNGTIVSRPADGGSRTVGFEIKDNSNTGLGRLAQNTATGDLVLETHPSSGLPEISIVYATRQIRLRGPLQFTSLNTAGFVKTDASGNASVDATTYATQTAVDDKLNKSDTAAMLANYQRILAVAPRKVLAKNTQVSNTGSTSEVEIYRDTIKVANYPFGLNTSLDIKLVFGSTSSTGVKTGRIKINGTTIGTTTQDATGEATMKFWFWISNRNSLSSQVTAGAGSSATGAHAGWSVAGQTAAPATYSFNTAQDLIITITSQLANGAEFQSIEQFEVIQNP